MIRAATILPVIAVTAAFITALPLTALQDPGFSVVVALVAFLALGAFARAIKTGALKIPAHGASFCLLALWAWLALSLAFSPAPFPGMIAFASFSVLPISFFALSALPERAEIFHILSRFFTLSMAAIAIPALWSAFALDGFGIRARWPVTDPNILATLFALSLPVAAAWWIDAAPSSARPARIVPAICFALCAAGIYATGSRAGFAAAILSMGVFIAFSGTGNLRRLRLPLTIAAATIGVFLATGFTGNTSILTRLGELFGGGIGNANLQSRIALYDGTFHMMMDHPLFGTGPGTFYHAYAAYRPAVTDVSLGAWAHCDPLQWGAESGIPAFLFFYAALIFVLIRTRTAIRDAGDRRHDILAPFCALLSVAVVAHFHFPLQMTALLIPAGVFLAQWHHAANAPDQTITIASRRGAMAAWAIMALVVSLYAGLIVQTGGAVFAMKRAEKSWRAHEPAVAIRHLMLADRLGPDSYIDPEVALARMNVSMLQAPNMKRAGAVQTQLVNDTAALLDTASAWNPYWADIDTLRGDMAAAIQLPDAARKHWITAIQKDPMQFSARLSLAQSLLDTGNRAESVVLLDEGLRYPHPGWYRDRAIAFLKEHGMVK